MITNVRKEGEIVGFGEWARIIECTRCADKKLIGIGGYATPSDAVSCKQAGSEIPPGWVEFDVGDGVRAHYCTGCVHSAVSDAYKPHLLAVSPQNPSPPRTA